MKNTLVTFGIALLLQGAFSQFNNFAAPGLNAGLGANFGLGPNLGIGPVGLGPNLGIGQPIGFGPNLGVGEPWQVITVSPLGPGGVTAVADNAFQASCGCGGNAVNVIDGLSFPIGLPGRGGLQFYPQ